VFPFHYDRINRVVMVTPVIQESLQLPLQLMAIRPLHTIQRTFERLQLKRRDCY
jgi:hypothetical protein